MFKRKTLFFTISIAIFLALYLGLKSFAQNKAERVLEEAFHKSAQYAEISYEDVSVNLFGLNIHIKGVTIAPADSDNETIIDQIVVYNVDRKNDFPRHLKMALRGIHIDRSSDIGEYFQDLGYDDEDMRIDVDLEYAYKKDEKSFNVDRLTYGAPRIGIFSLSFFISNIDLDSDGLFLTSSSLLDILIHKAELRYHDYSLVEKFMKMKAKDKGKDMGEYVQEILLELDRVIEKSEDTFVISLLLTFKDFVQNPGVISIRAEPEEPLPLERLMDIQELDEAINLLNISVGK